MTSRSSIVKGFGGENAGLDIQDNVLFKGSKIVLNHLGTEKSIEIVGDTLYVNGEEMTSGAAPVSETVSVETSRALTAEDDGQILECTTSGLTLTVPIGLGANFGCAVIPNGTTSIATSGGALVNGAGTTITRAAASNAMFALVSRVSATNSYVVTGE